MSARQGDGATLRTHLQRAARNTGKPDPQLIVGWPREGLEIWRAFQGIGRPQGFNGPGAITPGDILDYQDLHGVKFTAWEIEMIHAFDAIALESIHKQN